MGIRHELVSGVLLPVFATAQLASAQPNNAPIIDAEPRISIEPGFENAGKQAQCAFDAVRKIEIPASTLGAYAREPGHQTERARSAYVLTDSDSSVTLNYGTADEIILPNRSVHDISVSVRISNDDQGEYAQLRADHHGSYDPKVIDATHGVITLSFDKDGKLTGRDGTAFTDRSGESPATLVHGRWTIGAVQTLESEFAKCMDIAPETLEALGRSPSAATSVGLPPHTPGVGLLPRRDEPLF